MGGSSYLRWRWVAALACLQPGIDPIFLVLLSHNSGLPIIDHGWIVGASQAGMALGAVLAWRGPLHSSRALALAAALGGLGASLVTVLLDDFAALLLVRLAFGLCCGFLYNLALAEATAKAPLHAFGTIFLFQLLLAAGVSTLLPYVSGGMGIGTAMVCLALVPASVCLLLPQEAGSRAIADAVAEEKAPGPPVPVAPIAVLAMFICMNMMVWSYVGALATEARLSEEVIGWGVALGSLSGAIPALLLAHVRARLPLLVAGGLSGIAILSPLLAPAALGAAGFMLVMCLFNIGAIYAVVRFSSLAVDRNPSPHNRRAVAATHSIAMIAGPLSGALATRAGGFLALEALAAAALLVALLALAWMHRGAQKLGAGSLMLQRKQNFPDA
jgi:hypothetical protein